MVLSAAVLLFALAGGRPFTLEDAVRVRTVRELAVSPDRRSVAFTAREADLDAGLFRTSLWWSRLEGPARRLTFGADEVSGISFSPDGRRVGFLSKRGERTQAWAIPLDGGEAGRAAAHGAALARFAWAPDGSRRVLFVAPDPETAEEKRRREKKDDAYREGGQWRNHRLWVGPEGEAGRALTPADRHVSEAAWSPDGWSIAVITTPTPEADSRIDARLAVVDAASGALDEVAGGGGAADPEWSPEGRMLAFTRPFDGRDFARRDLYLWSPGSAPRNIYRPAEDAPGPRPLVVIPHGGPRDHTIAAYDPAAAYLAAQGYLVLRPNFRGSTGYGDAFARLNTGNWGDGPYRDVMAGVDALVGAGVADPARLFAYGWSYGGYLVNWIVTHTTRFRAAAGGAGVADLRMQYVLSDARRWRFDYFEGSPFMGHWPLYERESPITYAAAAKTPTLLFHGAEDVRVPLAQGTMMYRALRDNGVTTELVVYPREGHAFAEPRHVIDRLRRIEEWFSRHGGHR